ncbi:esterase FrsA [Nocardia sp. GAS34]|uniref:alpha/beta hydrolase family protein n=1 Tax=unclassified Nocardia TaxID=2637762 RepID=UPI003D1A4EF3
MAYEFAVDLDALYDERRPQFINQGLPAGDLDRAMARVDRMWSDGPGCWTYEFSSLAAEYADAGEHYRAALAYGVARFPVLADDAKRTAMALQVEQYTKAATTFGIHFERRILELPYRGGSTEVPVHLLSATPDFAQRPVVLVSGGIDSWKMDLHAIETAFVRSANVTVLAFDHPGTGETPAPLDAYADTVIDGLVDAARALGNGRVAHFGLSYGGNFAAASGLRGIVDAAIDLGGPIVESFTPENFTHLMFGMADIAGNAFGFTTQPTIDEILTAAQPFIRADLIAQDVNCPMLIVNGADDVHIVQQDSLLFAGRRDTEVHLIPDTGHVAASKLPEVIPLMVNWLRDQLV